MKLTCALLFAASFGVFATGNAQTMRVNIQVDNVSTEKVLSEIEKQTDYLFVYNKKEVDLKRKTSVNAVNKTTAEVLSTIFEGTDIIYAIEGENIILLPKDPMAEAREIREKIHHATGVDVGVIITDTCGRAFRRGQTGSAIGWAGMTAIRDFRGDHDLFGLELEITEEAVVDEIAAFSNFIMGESNNGVPVVKFSGCGTWKGHDSLYFTKEEDLIRKALHI